MKKIAPNDHCPCGSGKKYRKCCLKGNVAQADKAFFYYKLASEYSLTERKDEAIQCFKKAIALNPTFVGAYNDLGVAFADQGNLAEALACYNRALAINPDYYLAHNNIADAMHRLGRLDEAVDACRKAIALSPLLPYPHNNLGLSLSNLGKYDEAKVSLRKALEIMPDYLEALNNLGNILKQEGDYEGAISCYRRAIAINPRFVGSYNNMGGPLQNRGRHEEAISYLERALEIVPHDVVIHNNLVMYRQYSFAGSSEDVFAEALKFGRRFEEPLIGKWRRHENLRDSEKRLKVGFVSGDLRGHPVGFFLEGIIRHIDGDSLALYAYATQSAVDELSKRIKPKFEKWSFVTGFPDEVLVTLIRKDGIDILFDLSGHTSDNRLLAFAMKPAPLQVTWLGYPNTTGLKAMDYILADPITLPPEEEKYYTERALRLPDTYICYEPPGFDLEVNPPPALENGHVTFGSFNNPAKINDAVVECWAKIIAAVPGSRILFKFHKVFDREVERNNFLRRFSGFGIDPGRIYFEGYSSHVDLFAAYHRVDIALDPFPYTGVTTSCEALWMGVPTLTLRMERGIFGHNGELIMKTAGLSDWVASSVDEYVAKAAGFAGNTAHMAALRGELRQVLLASPLCDAPRFARHLEAALRGIWREWCRNNSH